MMILVKCFTWNLALYGDESSKFRHIECKFYGDEPSKMQGKECSFVQ
jgi:hypothetical protein